MADYDVIVIGAGLGGLSTAALLAKEGFKTLVLEQSDLIGGCCSTYETAGYRFDVGASIVEILQPMDRFFELMGKKREDYIDLVPCDPIYSFNTPEGQRFSYPTDIDETTKVIEQIAPEDVEGWKRFCAQAMYKMDEMMDSMMLAPMNTMGEAMAMTMKNPNVMKFLPLLLRTHQAVTRSYYKNPIIQASVAFQSYFAGAPPEIGSGIFGFIALTEHLGIFYPRGGMIAIPEAMMKAGQEYGLEVRTGQKVEKILVDGRTVRGVLLEDGTGRVQTVTEQQHGRYYRVIKRFGELTGVPVVINTSFNVRGEPIVCTPQDAYRTFVNTGIDALVIGNYVVTQKPEPVDYEAGMQRSVELEAGSLAART